MGYSLNVKQPIHFDEIEHNLMINFPHYDELNNDLINFISHRIPNEKIRNYFMQRTSQTLLGVDKYEIISIWSANGHLISMKFPVKKTYLNYYLIRLVTILVIYPGQL